jgi:HopA1 effector protein family
MQLLNSQPTKLLPESLQISLADIIHRLQIQSHLCISHPDYKPLKLPESAIPRFQQLPSDLQNKYLSSQLSNFIYGIYYNGSLKRALAPDREGKNLAVKQNLENNTLLGVDVVFYDRLHENNKGEGYFSQDWLVVKKEEDGSLAVHRDGLTLYVEPDKHLSPEEQNATIGDSVAIKVPKNVVQNGFYMAVSNAAPQTEVDTVRVYFNLTTEGAVAVMSSLTGTLNAINIPFTFKALYNPSDYGRYDSAVLYFDKSNYQRVHPVLEKVYSEQRSHFQKEVPLFTKLVAPGLAIAEEPEQKFSEQESFGTNRCQIIANGLLEAWHQGDDSPESRMAAILKQFASVEVELERPYLNPNSEDIYQELKL